MLGTRTKKVVTRSITSQNNGQSDGKSISYQAIPLLRPDEIMKMSSKISLIIRSGYAPVKAKQFIWYQESSMKQWKKCSVFVPIQVAQQIAFIRKKNSMELNRSLFEGID